ncbi:bifunctional lysine ketoglutarate reductase /saccharopine dehydrogenase family protein [Candidatus Riflebacteria bacterium]
MKIGIRREDKNRWEARVPLVPEDVAKLIVEHGFEIMVQPSSIRAFTDAEYKVSGAKIVEDLSPCDVVFAVKEIPEEFLRPEGTYVFFSHTIKGQSYNLPMLEKLMELGCNLIDYEKIEKEVGKRLVFFGTFAGEAGMIDSLWAYGQRLEAEGISSPFSRIKQVNKYRNLDYALRKITQVGKEIEKGGIPEALKPLIVGFLGYGNVSKGAQSVLDCLPVENLPPAKLYTLDRQSIHNNCIYKVVFKEEDMVEPNESGIPFALKDYFQFPEKYHSIFEKYLPHLSIIMNCIFWSKNSPKFVSKHAVRELFQNREPPALRMIGDISCDIDGGVEITSKATDSGDPVYVWDVATGEAIMGVKGNGPVILAVDNLPCELPIDSCIFFSQALSPLVPEIVNADFSKSYAELALSEPLKNGLILHRGKLTPGFQYMQNYLHGRLEGENK